MDVLRILIGVGFILLGVWIFYVSKSWIAGAGSVAVGVIVLVFSAQEGKIEQRKDLNKKSGKK